MESKTEQYAAGRWLKKCMILLVSLLLIVTLLMVIVDPYFHYHAPLSFMSYRLFEERYINDGISRNFDYDAIITGTSMAQNFKTSQMDELFGTRAVKEPLPGAGYQELCENLDRALGRNDQIKTVIMAVDYNGLLRDYDWSMYEEYPTYLYDDNYFNDVYYMLNKSVLYHGLLNNLFMTFSRQPSTSMDEYSSWENETGIEHIMGSYNRQSLKPDEYTEFDTLDCEMVTQTIKENIVQLVNKYPNTTFYLFYTPYSICYWDALNLQNILLKQLEAEKVANELLLECPNVKLYSFFDKQEIICDLDYYNDLGHYSDDVNSQILYWIAHDVGLITEANYLKKLDAEKEFFTNYDYEGIYE